MAKITFDLDDAVAEKFEKYKQAFGTDGKLFDEFLEYYRQKNTRELDRMAHELKTFEDKYEISSESFHHSYNKGKLDDSKDFITWAGLYEMHLETKKRLTWLS